jgi:hypothetical protein
MIDIFGGGMNDNFIIIEDNIISNETTIESLLRKSITFNNFKLQSLSDKEIIKKWHDALFKAYHGR